MKNNFIDNTFEMKDTTINALTSKPIEIHKFESKEKIILENESEGKDANTPLYIRSERQTPSLKQDSEQTKKQETITENLEQIKQRKEFYAKLKDNVIISQAKGKVHDIMKSREDYFIEFSFGFFFKFLFYHIIYFFILGPMFGIILGALSGFSLAKNMAFHGCNFGTTLQFVMFLAGGPCLFLTIFYKMMGNSEMLKYFTYYELLFCVLAVFIRCIIIACRYGLSTKSNVQLRYERLLTPAEIKKEFVLSGWKNVDKFICDQEVTLALARNQIDVEIFTCRFLSKVSDYWMQRLGNDTFYETEDANEYEKAKTIQREDLTVAKKCSSQDIRFDHNLYASIKPVFVRIKEEKMRKAKREGSLKGSTFVKTPSKASSEIGLGKSDAYRKLVMKMSYKFQSIREINYSECMSISMNEQLTLPLYYQRPDREYLLTSFPGRVLIRELLIFSKVKSGKLFGYVFTFAIIFHSITPIIYRAIIGQPPFGANILEGFLIVICAAVGIIAYLISMLFIESGANDYSRKLYLQKCLQAMLITDKITIPDEDLRLIPTINIFCPKSLKTWLYLRLLVNVIGKRYTTRIEAYASIFIITYICLLVILILGFFKVIKGIDPSDTNFQIFYIMGFMEVILTIIVLFRMMYLGAQNNKFFRTHIYQLSLIKASYIDLIQNYHLWKDMKTYTNMYLEKAKQFYFFCKEYHGNEELKEEYCDMEDYIPNTDDESFKNHFRNLVQEMDQIIQRLELEEKDCPLELLGIKLTEDLMNQLYVACITIAFTLIQSSFQNSGSTTAANNASI
jgi:hypothetical protein